MPEALLQMYNDLNPVFKQEAFDFMMYLLQKQNKKSNDKKSFDTEYNALVSDISTAVSDRAKATIWEQIKDDTW